MTPAEYFEQIAELKKQIKATKPTSAGNSKRSKQITKMLELTQKINEASDELTSFQLKLNKEIDEIACRNHRSVLRARYLQGKEWEEIAAELECSYNKIITLHEQALKEFEKIILTAP